MGAVYALREGLTDLKWSLDVGKFTGYTVQTLFEVIYNFGEFLPEAFLDSEV